MPSCMLKLKANSKSAVNMNISAEFSIFESTKHYLYISKFFSNLSGRKNLLKKLAEFGTLGIIVYCQYGKRLFMQHVASSLYGITRNSASSRNMLRETSITIYNNMIIFEKIISPKNTAIYSFHID